MENDGNGIKLLLDRLLLLNDDVLLNDDDDDAIGGKNSCNLIVERGLK